MVRLTATMTQGMMLLMSITTEPGQDFFSDDTYFRTHPLAAPSFLIQEPIDRLTEDEVPMDELEDAMWHELQVGRWMSDAV